MNGKRFFTAEGLVLLCIGLVLVLAAGGIALSVRSFVPADVPPGAGIRYGKYGAYDAVTCLIRENTGDLKQMLEIASDLPVNGSIDQKDAARRYTELAGLMQAHGITGIFREPEMWVLDTQHSGGIVTSSTTYQILYTADDPRNLVTTWNDENDPWTPSGGGWLQKGGNIAYLEEVAKDFYYFYLAT